MDFSPKPGKKNPPYRNRKSHIAKRTQQGVENKRPVFFRSQRISSAIQPGLNQLLGSSPRPFAATTATDRPSPENSKPPRTNLESAVSQIGSSELGITNPATG